MKDNYYDQNLNAQKLYQVYHSKYLRGIAVFGGGNLLCKKSSARDRADPGTGCRVWTHHEGAGSALQIYSRHRHLS